MALEDTLYRDDHSPCHHLQAVQTTYCSHARRHSDRLEGTLNVYRVCRLEGQVVVATFHPPDKGD